MEPWDGPAAIWGLLGDWAIAGMDRNGLRPIRYTNKKSSCAGSETGMVDVRENEILEKVE